MVVDAFVSSEVDWITVDVEFDFIVGGVISTTVCNDIFLVGGVNERDSVVNGFGVACLIVTGFVTFIV